jgi:hypothetical protein
LAEALALPPSVDSTDVLASAELLSPSSLGVPESLLASAEALPDADASASALAGAPSSSPESADAFAEALALPPPDELADALAEALADPLSALASPEALASPPPSAEAPAFASAAAASCTRAWSSPADGVRDSAPATEMPSARARALAAPRRVARVRCDRIVGPPEWWK